MASSTSLRRAPRPRPRRQVHGRRIRGVQRDHRLNRLDDGTGRHRQPMPLHQPRPPLRGAHRDGQGCSRSQPPLEKKHEDHYPERSRAPPLHHPRARSGPSRTACIDCRTAPQPSLPAGARRVHGLGRSAGDDGGGPVFVGVDGRGRGLRRPSRRPSPLPAGRSSPPAARRRARASRARPTRPGAGSRARRDRRRARPAARGRAPRPGRNATSPVGTYGALQIRMSARPRRPPGSAPNRSPT